MLRKGASVQRIICLIFEDKWRGILKDLLLILVLYLHDEEEVSEQHFFARLRKLMNSKQSLFLKYDAFQTEKLSSHLEEISLYWFMAQTKTKLAARQLTKSFVQISWAGKLQKK